MRWILAVMMVGCTGENRESIAGPNGEAPECPTPILECPRTGRQWTGNDGGMTVTQCLATPNARLWHLAQWPDGSLAILEHYDENGTPSSVFSCWPSAGMATETYFVENCRGQTGERENCSVVREDFDMLWHAAAAGTNHPMLTPSSGAAPSPSESSQR